MGYATRPSAGPHKLRECIPLTVLLQNRLKYALSGQDAIKICRNRDGNIKIDNKIRRDPRFPLGFMDVVQIPKTRKPQNPKTPCRGFEITKYQICNLACKINLN